MMVIDCIFMVYYGAMGYALKQKTPFLSGVCCTLSPLFLLIAIAKTIS